MRAELIAIFGFAAVLSGSPALASDLSPQLPLAEVLRKARSNPAIKLQVGLQLKRAKVGLDTVFCRAGKLDQSWVRLAGTVTGPYACPLGAQVLTIGAHQRYTDATGARVPLSAPDLKARAAAVTEVRFRWRWSRTAAGAPR